MEFNTTEEIIQDIAAGKMVILLDDEDRENEGDLVCAAELVDDKKINFMISKARGLVCLPLSPQKCDQLNLPMMTNNNRAKHGTGFTVSIEAAEGISTGISAEDRAKTIIAAAKKNAKAGDIVQPGHIFPLIAKDGGVLRRVGHTEAAVDLARLAGLAPAGVIVEIMNEDGTMARLPQLIEIAAKHDLKIITIEDLVAYRMAKESLIELEEKVQVTTPHGEFTLHAFEQKTNHQVHLALTMGEWELDEIVPVRIHSAGVANDIFHLLTSNESSRLEKALKSIATSGHGAIIYMNQEPNGDRLLSRIQSFKQDQDHTTPSFTKDTRDFGIGAQIIHYLGIRKVDLLTNNPIKRVGVSGYGIEIVKNSKLE